MAKQKRITPKGKPSPEPPGREIVILQRKIEIPDLRILALFDPLPQGASKEDQIAHAARMGEKVEDVLEFLERVVEGGTKGIPLSEIGTVVTLINKALTKGSKKGN